MDSNKVCFITCVNDERLYEESLLYIKQLHVPPEIKLEFVAVRGAASLTQGYNQGMKSSNAKYKVYLHQDAFIVHRDFIVDIMKIFRDDDAIGLIGLAGNKMMPVSGRWWDNDYQYGAICDSSSGKMRSFRKAAGPEPYREVQVVDGVIMATQYDTPWRDDLFTGWHFYDIAQCVEFKRAGYKVTVPNQVNTWCIHDSGTVQLDDVYEKYRNVFLDEYSKDLFPLVSILIPTYNRPHYFQQALESALNQTYRNIEIIVGDDSTNEETKKVITPYLAKYKNICYYYHGKSLGGGGGYNFRFVYDKAQGQYVNWLMDDDLFHPDKISRMMKYYLENPTVTLVSSCRNCINENGEKICKLPEVDFVKDAVIEGKVIAKYMMDTVDNFIGEPTTVLINRDLFSTAYGATKASFGKYASFPFEGLSDMMTWMEFAQKGDIAFISDELSSFRKHPGQKTWNPTIGISMCVDYFNFITLTYLKNEYIKTEHEYQKYCKLWLKAYNHTHVWNCTKATEVEADEYFSWLADYYKKIFRLIENQNYKVAFNEFICMHIASYSPYKALEKFCIKRNGLWERANDKDVKS